MTTSVPPYSRVASVSSILFRAACWICLRIIPGRVALPAIALLLTVYLFSYWLGGRQVAALDKAKLDAATESRAAAELEAAHNGDTENGEVNGRPAVSPIRKHRDTDNAPGTTMLLTLPTSSRMLRRISLFANLILFLMVIDFVTKPYFIPANDLTFARVGAVDSTSAKIIVRYPAPVEASTVTTVAAAPTPRVTQAVQDAVDGLLPGIALPSPRTASLRVQWRKSGFSTNALDTLWTDGPIVEISESRDWVGMTKLTGLQAGTEYEYRLTELNGTVWGDKSLSFHTIPDSRLSPGSHFRFVSTSCVIPNFPYSVFAQGIPIKGFDLLADHIQSTQPTVENTPAKTEEPAVAASIAAAPQGNEQVPLVVTEVPPSVSVKPTPAVEFLMFMGDFIYADMPYYFGDTVQAYRRLYRRVYASLSFRKIYERLPVYNIYDDHEFINNFSGNNNDSTPPFPHASAAYNIYNGQANPDSRTSGVNYYDFRHGDTAFFVMDTRRYRSPPPPKKSLPFPLSYLTPLIAAIAEGKNPFAPYFGEPVATPSPIDESTRTMLGRTQLAALRSWIIEANRTATWKFVVSSVPLTAMWAGYDGGVDLWTGYMKERETVLDLLGSVPNVVVLSGDRHEFAAVEFPRGKYVVREFSTSPLNQFYVPFFHTFSPDNARKVSVTRAKTVVSETGEESVEKYTEEVEEETLIKYVPDGNHKWSTFEVDSTDPKAPKLKAELFVDGKLSWEYEVTGDPVELVALDVSPIREDDYWINYFKYKTNRRNKKRAYD